MSWGSIADGVIRGTQRVFRVDGVTIYTPPEGAAVELEDVIFRGASLTIDAESGLSTIVERPRARVRLADLPDGDALEGALLEFPAGVIAAHPGGIAYSVERVLRDGEGAAELELHEVEP